MKRHNIGLAMVCAIVTFFGVEFMYGESGLLAYRVRSSVAETLQENVSRLHVKHQTLMAEVAYLQTNPEYVLSQSSRSGYFSDSQGLIITDGDYGSSQIWEIGRVTYIPDQRSDGRPVRAGTAGILGMLVYVLLSIFGSSTPNRNFKVEATYRRPMHHAM